MPALQRKLLRELWQLKAQIATIALVLAGGVASFVALRGNYSSLQAAVAAYYADCHFADVFAHLERAPLSVQRRIERLDGVQRVEARLEENIALPIEGMPRPASAVLLSLPTRRPLTINALRVQRGRLPLPDHGDEVVVHDGFAAAHGLELGQALPAVINGKLRHLRVVGTVLSPEFIYAIRPGAMVDDPKHHTVIWMDEDEMASAFELGNAFNSLVLRTSSDAREGEVLSALDRILEPYGGRGSIGRRDQVSNHIVSGELMQLQTLSGMVPGVFLAVVAFLVNLVLSRFIALQRPEIAALKALGYTDAEVRTHYLMLVVVVILPGLLLGAALGTWLGNAVLKLYATVFRVPNLHFDLSWQLLTTAFASSAVAAISGAFFAVRAAVKLAPAEAMRPPAPARYRRSVLEALGAHTLLSTAGMMVARELERRPLRTLLSSLGIAGAVALSILGRFGWDSFVDYFNGTFQLAQRQDLSVVLAKPLSPEVVQAIRTLDGVILAEPQRLVGVRVHNGHRSRDAALIGVEPGSDMRQLVGRKGDVVKLADEGVVMTTALAEILHARVGDRVFVKLREGAQVMARPIVAGLVDEAFGLQLYGSNELLAELAGDAGAVNQVLLRVDPTQTRSVEQRLKRSPYVVDVSDLRGDMVRMMEMNSSFMSIWTLVSVLMASGVIFGVVYNNARIALATRSRELASLRVLGFTRAEVARVLLGALGLEVFVAIPTGLWLGTRWAEAMMRDMDPETYRWAVVVAPSTYALSAAMALLASAASTVWIHRSLERLDLISALKTRN